MKQRMQQILAGLLMVVGLTFTGPLVSAADPVDVLCPKGQVAGANGFCKANSDTEVYGLVKIVINVLLTLAGIVAVIMIIIGGFRYTISNGDANAATAARHTLLYAVIGLVITGGAFVIVNFVIGQF